MTTKLTRRTALGMAAASVAATIPTPVSADDSHLLSLADDSEIVFLDAEVRKASADRNAVDNTFDHAEDERWFCSPDKVPGPCVQAGDYLCISSEDEIRSHCQPLDANGPSAAQCRELVAKFNRQDAVYRAARDKAGMTPFEETCEAAGTRWHEAYAKLASAVPTTIEGVLVKVRHLATAIEIGSLAVAHPGTAHRNRTDWTSRSGK